MNRWALVRDDTVRGYLFTDATKAATRLSLVVKADVLQGLSEHQYAALVSFVFNLGAGRSWAIWPLLNAKQFDAVPVQMMRFDKARVNGQLVEIPGLFNRRAAEVNGHSEDERDE